MTDARTCQSFLEFYHMLIDFVCICMHMGGFRNTTARKCRSRQLKEVNSFLTVWVLGMALRLAARQQVPLSAEPSSWPLDKAFKGTIIKTLQQAIINILETHLENRNYQQRNKRCLTKLKLENLKYDPEIKNSMNRLNMRLVGKRRKSVKQKTEQKKLPVKEWGGGS